ncbi:hypothetical protein SFC23_12270 [Shouchella clausii]|uniref:hypothetical protein n=1 Tax=Shouchella clausii TaxID=79880 RepID=UPI000BA7C272|nr:hypothetical protein [Shouchella clausii]PAD92981.1 hypothetical protein CHH52_06915 [Shouchella clausii]
MKRIFYGIVLVIVILGIHHDLTGGTFAEEKGTPPAPLAVQVEEVQGEDEPSLPYQEVIIEPGQTVLSVVEHLHGRQVDRPIESIIADFRELNEQMEPNALQVGGRYRFPLYDDEPE